MKDSNEKILKIEAARKMFGEKTHQAIYQAIYKGRLKAKRVNGHWVVTEEDLIEYHKTKHCTEARIFNGRPLYSIDEGRLSVAHVAKLLGKNPQTIYYAIRRGFLISVRHGGTYVIRKEDALRYQALTEQIQNSAQLRFA